MVRCLALFILLLAAPAMAADEDMQQITPPHGTTARAEASVTILRGEEIRMLSRQDRGTVQPNRQERTLPNDQIRIDFY